MPSSFSPRKGGISPYERGRRFAQHFSFTHSRISSFTHSRPAKAGFRFAQHSCIHSLIPVNSSFPFLDDHPPGLHINNRRRFKLKILPGVFAHDYVESFHFFIEIVDKLNLAKRQDAAVLHAVTAGHFFALPTQNMIGTE